MGQRGAIDVHLARERLKRHVVVTLPYFNLAPYVLIKSDLIFTTTRLFADYYAKFLPLTVVPAPLDFPPMQYYQLWHERVPLLRRSALAAQSGCRGDQDVDRQALIVALRSIGIRVCVDADRPASSIPPLLHHCAYAAAS